MVKNEPKPEQKKYDPGASDTEIKIGNIMPYSGPVSGYSIIGKTEAAYFNKVNAEGGKRVIRRYTMTWQKTAKPGFPAWQAGHFVRDYD